MILVVESPSTSAPVSLYTTPVEEHFKEVSRRHEIFLPKAAASATTTLLRPIRVAILVVDPPVML